MSVGHQKVADLMISPQRRPKQLHIRWAAKQYPGLGKMEDCKEGILKMKFDNSERPFVWGPLSSCLLPVIDPL